jgi:hypothetical protein
LVRPQFVMPEILPAKKMASDSPVPYYLAAGNKLKYNIEKGRLLTYGMIDHDPKSCLWKLRRGQDELFGVLGPIPVNEIFMLPSDMVLFLCLFQSFYILIYLFYVYV